MIRFTLEVQTDGANDILNLRAELKNRIKELRGEGILHLFMVGSTASDHHPGIVNPGWSSIDMPEDWRLTIGPG